MRPRLLRTVLQIAVCGLCVAAAAGPVAAQSQGGSSNQADAQPKTLVTQDGWRIHITYFNSTKGKESPVVILLHDEGENRLVWQDGFAERLQEHGFAAITVDLRKHGQSMPRRGGRGSELRPGDYVGMIRGDLEAVKEFIFQEHQKQKLNMRKTAIVAPGMAAPIAVNYAAYDWQKRPWDDAPNFSARTPRGQDIRALVLLSPEDHLPRMPTTKALNFLRNPRLGVSFLFCYGTEDGGSASNARKMHKQVAPNEKNKARMLIRGYKTKRSGTGLLESAPGIEEFMLAFLTKYLKERPGQWQDRCSPLDDDCDPVDNAQ